MLNLLRSFAQDDSGATSIEYALIASLIFVVIVTSVTLMSEQLGEVFQTVGDSVSDAISGSDGG